VTDPWLIVAGPVEVALAFSDNDAWTYWLKRADAEWKLMVETPPGLQTASDPNTHPAVPAAQQSCGRSEVELVVHLDDPPNLIRIAGNGERRWWRYGREIPVELPR
jgi:hypothetical protein